MRIHPAKARTARKSKGSWLLTPMIALLASAALVASAGASSPLGSAVQTKPIGASSNGKTISLARGTHLAISLKEGSDGGYHWVVATMPKASVLRILSDRSIPPHLAPGEVGGMSTRKLLLKATGTGITTLKMFQLGPGETKARHSPHDEAFTVTVRVR